ncbi:MAG TPA: Hsp20/alpha crystallin family protein [Chloroflexia bacterium]
MLARDLLRNNPQTSVWRDLARLQDEMNSLLSRGLSSAPAGFPAVNIWTGEDSAIVTAELPGIVLDDLDITVVGDTLTIRGSRTRDEIGEGATYHRRERGFGRFMRVVQLPFRVEQEQVEAAFKNGVLSITLPRALSDRPRKIQIKTA